jgi:hypothetical protein
VKTPHHQQKSPAQAGPNADRSRLRNAQAARAAAEQASTMPVTGPLNLENRLVASGGSGTPLKLSPAFAGMVAVASLAAMGRLPARLRPDRRPPCVTPLRHTRLIDLDWSWRFARIFTG